jgi:PPP family 3-phenylpropionic acid transporter
MGFAADRVPAVRLSAFYFLWFGGLGALLPYWGLYMKDRGHGAAEIGVIFAILLGTKVIAPNIWGALADRSGRRVRVISVATAAAALFFLGVPFAPGFAAMAALMIGYGFFSNASLPQFEVVTFNHLGAQEHRYGLIRLWGSVGFIISVVALGVLVSHAGTTLVPWWVFASLVGLFLLSRVVPEPPPGPAETSTSGGLLSVFMQPAVLCLIVVCALSQFSHGAYYGFFSLYMEDAGFGRTLIGVLWALGVLAEVLVFAFLPGLVRRFGLRWLMIFALTVTTARWVLLAAFAEWLAVVIVAQLLHLASFGIYHAVAVNMIHRLFRGRLQGRGQALYSSLSFGLGGALGSLASGMIWEISPGPAAFWVAAAAAGLGAAVAIIGLREPPPVPAQAGAT